jgi:hypothetical protein
MQKRDLQSFFDRYAKKKKKKKKEYLEEIVLQMLIVEPMLNGA